MATSNTVLQVTELDFESIKSNLKQFLRNQSEFQDYDFEGSGMSVLLDILAYNTHYMAFYLNMTGNEMFLDTAQIRSSVLSHAKNINYVPRSKLGATAILDIIVTPGPSENSTVTSLKLDKYHRFLGQDVDGVNHTFVAKNANTTIKSNGSFTFSNVMLIQGEVTTVQYLADSSNPKRRFTIPSANVDTTTISVLVQDSGSSTQTSQYVLAEDVTELNANSKVFFFEEDSDLNYTLYFGDGYIGKRPVDGNIITCTFVDTLGSQGSSISNFSLAGERIGGLYRDNVAYNVTSTSFGGSEKETIEQIKYRAPYSYITQNRAVTTQDYKTLILKDYPTIEAISVWGGEDNDPIVYGKVFISLKTKQNFALTNADKEFIKKELIRTRNVLTVTPEIIDPEFAYVRVVAKVYYNSNLTGLDKPQLASLVEAAIFDYNDRELNQFESVFRKSKLQTYIEGADTSITGSDVDVQIQKRVILDTTSSKKYDVQFNMPLKKGSYESKLTSFPEILSNDNNGVQRNVLFEEILDAPSGINSISVTNGGSNYTSVPSVSIVGDGSGAIARARVVNGRVNSIEIIAKGVDYTKATITITGGDGSGATASARLENDFGTIRTFYYKVNGEKVIINTSAGIINYATGLVTINSIRTEGAVENDFYDADIVTFLAPAANEVIYPLRNRIFIVDDTDPKSTQVEMVTES